MPQPSNNIVLHEGLPLYYMDPEGNLVDFVAFVDRPAIKRGFLAFSEQAPKPMQFTVASEERRIVSGPLMLADTPIYREQDGQGFYVTFPAKAIEKIVQSFFASGFQRNVNLQHDPGQRKEGVIMFESFISDPERGIPPMKGYEDAPAGSWFGSFRVDNEEVWEKVKSGEFTGFSVEGLFSPVPVEAEMTDEEITAELHEIMGMLP
jgi:hypothetical protein